MNEIPLPFPQYVCDKIQRIINEHNRQRPPQDFYQGVDGITAIKNEANEFWEIDTEKGLNGWEFDNGIRLYMKGAQFPLRGFVDHEILWHINIIKSIVIENVKIISSWRFIPSIILLVLSKKELNRIIKSFTKLTWRIAVGRGQSIILKENNLTPQGLHLTLATFLFLVKIGIEEKEADRVSLILSHILEYDNAYKLRFEDLVSTINDDNLCNRPIREILKLMKTVREREWYVYELTGESVINSGAANKTISILKLLCIALLIPKVRKALRETLSEVPLEKMGLDEIDTYWVCLRSDYKFLGMDLDERKKYAESRGWVLPKPIK